MRVDIRKNTDQLNYEDFLRGVTRIVTIAGVERGRKEAQYDIAIEGDDRYWRPPPTVLKLLVSAWGDEAADWTGRSAELYGDPDVMMAGKKVGGIRVSRLSHIDKPISANLSETRGKRKIHTVDPLTMPTPPSESAIACATDRDQLLAWGQQFPHLRPVLKARMDELDGQTTGGES
ncbi:hypothetical protein CFH99_07935 [Nocardioides aromaticivorans]|uniref:Uncharacterized protein n=1 Tax=Nocardioides aromaticivorans TaxID=200618 RepID=A0ABX7PHX6_9ACTN|nr:hypothetical protein [Nocardioides aromaticivorans]QSR25551.1 hypothetical protein CFH99_07935 [Nocardioides aromaticivorans]